MEVSKTKLEGVLLIRPPTIFEDFRGTYVETYEENGGAVLSTTINRYCYVIYRYLPSFLD